MKPIPQRFLEKCLKQGDCWIWIGARTSGGYGRFKWKGKTKIASRWLYEYLNGELPKDIYIDHICKNPPCVQQDHLRLATPRQNVMWGNTIVRMNAEKTYCIRGHELLGKNLLIRRDGRRRCQVCEKVSAKRSRQRPEFKQKRAAYERMRRKERKYNEK